MRWIGASPASTSSTRSCSSAVVSPSPTWSADATRYLHLNGERLAPSAKLADYQVFNGALLHLILDPIDAPDGVALETGCSGRVLLVFRFSDELKGRIEFGRPGVLDRLFRDLAADHRGTQVWVPFNR